MFVPIPSPYSALPLRPSVCLYAVSGMIVIVCLCVPLIVDLICFAAFDAAPPSDRNTETPNH